MPINEVHLPTNDRGGTPTILITGATDGLGKALAFGLSGHSGIRLVLHGRSPERLEKLEQELTGGPADIITVQGDLAELAQVARLADRIRGLADDISVLINNAGVSAGHARQLSADGHELCFAVNYLAPFLLTKRLLPLLLASALRAGAPARVVNVASLSQTSLDFDDLAMAHGYTRQRAYSASKLALVMAGMELAERYDPGVLTVNSVHPGTYMPTKMLDSPELSIDSLDTGVRSTLRLAFAPELSHITGRFFDRGTETNAHPDAYRSELRTELWEISNELTAD
ncbi:SDR family NAD(P)-dependent oxidoreductase [Arthrobacter sp. zg-Y1143]|uniref:SDR family NAD(P)-dependent oxidoreductase n=1 Tax=Arthrobacter sp. zg-Y1143 TaxID=3049065 RepID=UPI0024C2E445|nr:SDR family NAD(P)-dependent oxidoreductase [Arthrobacter sp. zg-Y1143]MDK1326504.1 SDR family NAD(P)-dependent oxidoreductase [Arthrobacter sp. zg-Y1143]